MLSIKHPVSIVTQAAAMIVKVLVLVSMLLPICHKQTRKAVQALPLMPILAKAAAQKLPQLTPTLPSR